MNLNAYYNQSPSIEHSINQSPSIDKPMKKLKRFSILGYMKFLLPTIWGIPIFYKTRQILINTKLKKTLENKIIEKPCISYVDDSQLDNTLGKSKKSPILNEQDNMNEDLESLNESQKDQEKSNLNESKEKPALNESKKGKEKSVLNESKEKPALNESKEQFNLNESKSVLKQESSKNSAFRKQEYGNDKPSTHLFLESINLNLIDNRKLKKKIETYMEVGKNILSIKYMKNKDYLLVFMSLKILDWFKRIPNIDRTLQIILNNYPYYVYHNNIYASFYVYKKTISNVKKKKTKNLIVQYTKMNLDQLNFILKNQKCYKDAIKNIVASRDSKDTI